MSSPITAVKNPVQKRADSSKSATKHPDLVVMLVEFVRKSCICKLKQTKKKKVTPNKLSRMTTKLGRDFGRISARFC